MYFHFDIVNLKISEGTSRLKFVNLKFQEDGRKEHRMEV